MSEESTVPATFAELEQQHPEIAQRVREELALKPTVQAEAELGAYQGESKKVRALGLADATVTAIAQGTYDVIDMFAGFPGPVDVLIRNVICPALPELIDQAAAFFHRINVFAKLRPTPQPEATPPAPESDGQAQQPEADPELEQPAGESEAPDA